MSQEGFEGFSHERDLGTINDVSFTRHPKPDGSYLFRNSHPNRKSIELEPGVTVEPGVAYDVEIIRDTNPRNSNKGKYIVRLVRESGVSAIMEQNPFQERVDKPAPIEVDRKNNVVYVLETAIEYNPQGGELVPSPKEFESFTLDARTLHTIERIAEAVELKQPCLLEGETATSKTSSIMYLAMRANMPVIRINMNGQSDTSELIGKYVPNDGQLQISFEQALRHPENVPESAKAIIQNAKDAGRVLDKIESQKVAEALGLKIPEWRWQDGALPKAQKEGYWLILDEWNLAEAPIRERINSATEMNGSTTIYEHEGEKIGPGGEHEVHRMFRVFATENPAEYAGRKPMSKAEKDRWQAYEYVPQPNAEQYEQMMHLMVYGKQPLVKIGDVEYQALDIEPQFGRLSGIKGFKFFLALLAQFHESAEKAASKNEIGRGNKEKYIFTRRGLISLLTYLEKKVIVDRKTGDVLTVKDDPQMFIQKAIRYVYLDRMKPGQDGSKDDEQVLKDKLDALGIGEKTWTLHLPKSEKTAFRNVKVGDVFTAAKVTEVTEEGIRVKLHNDLEVWISKAEFLGKDNRTKLRETVFVDDVLNRIKITQKKPGMNLEGVLVDSEGNRIAA